MARDLDRLVCREGFLVHAGSWGEESGLFSGTNYAGPLKLKRAMVDAPGSLWAGFQLFYRMSEDEVQSATGLDLVESMLAVYREVIPAMNLCMQIELVDQTLSPAKGAIHHS
jgi:hypothetical protein